MSQAFDEDMEVIEPSLGETRRRDSLLGAHCVASSSHAQMYRCMVLSGGVPGLELGCGECRLACAVLPSQDA